MSSEMHNAPTGGRGAVVNCDGFVRQRIAAGRRMEPLQCGHVDHWLTPCHRPTLTAESVLASVIHLNGNGSWTTADLRRAWMVADTDQERATILNAHKQGAA